MFVTIVAFSTTVFVLYEKQGMAIANETYQLPDFEHTNNRQFIENVNKCVEHECDSVLHYINTLNNGHAYEKYRELRDNGVMDPFVLVETLDAYASDVNYFDKVKSILKKLKEEYDIKF